MNSPERELPSNVDPSFGWRRQNQIELERLRASVATGPGHERIDPHRILPDGTYLSLVRTPERQSQKRIIRVIEKIRELLRPFLITVDRDSDFDPRHPW